MKFGKVDINPAMGKLKWSTFQKFYKEHLEGKIKEEPEFVFGQLGGTLPKKKKTDEGV